MAKVKYGGGIQDLRGSIAGQVHSRNTFGNYIRQKVSPVQPRTSRQLEVRELFTSFSPLQLFSGPRGPSPFAQAKSGFGYPPCMNAYAKGRAFEQEVSRYLRGKGIWVVRSAGSKGAADLVAWYGGRRALLQCKLGSEPSKNELNALRRMAKDMVATAWVIAKPPRGEPRAYLVHPGDEVRAAVMAELEVEWARWIRQDSVPDFIAWLARVGYNANPQEWDAWEKNVRSFYRSLTGKDRIPLPP